MGKTQTRLPFLGIVINNTGTKIRMNIFNKTTDSKRYAPFTSNNPRHYLINIPSSLARRIFAIFENEKVKEKRFKALKKNITATKILYVAKSLKF